MVDIDCLNQSLNLETCYEMESEGCSVHAKFLHSKDSTCENYYFRSKIFYSSSSSTCYPDRYWVCLISTARVCSLEFCIFPRCISVFWIQLRFCKQIFIGLWRHQAQYICSAENSVEDSRLRSPLREASFCTNDVAFAGFLSDTYVQYTSTTIPSQRHVTLMQSNKVDQWLKDDFCLHSHSLQQKLGQDCSKMHSLWWTWFEVSAD